MKKLCLSLLCGAVLFASGCDSVNHLMTYRSPANMSVQEAEDTFKELSVSGNVFDGAVIVRSAMDDEVAFDAKSSVYDFETGRSVYRTYNLPLNATNLKVDISVQIGQTVFAPSVALLNKEKKLIKMFDFNSFEYRPYNDLVAERLRFKFSLNNFSAGERAVAYMVIFSKEQDLKSFTKVVHPAKLFAISHRQQVPQMEDPLIAHSRLGSMTVVFSMDAESIDTVSDFLDSLKGPIWGGETHQYMTDDDDGSVMPTVSVNADSNIRAVNPAVSADGNVAAVNPAASGSARSTAGTAVASAAAKTAPKAAPGSMMKETENMYNAMIESSVKAGDISKAMQLAAEATNAGSASANDTLNRALRSYRK